MLAVRNPELLWLLLLLLVPLLLYLLPMPRRQVATSALFLWERFLRSERLGRTSERFRRALGLALFLAILASLLLAAAGPVVGQAPIQARRLVVLVDASASMNAVVDGKSNLDRAKAAAQELIESLGSRTQVAVAEAAGGLNVLAPFRSAGFSPYLGGLKAALRAVQEIEPFDGPTDMRRVLKEAERLWGEDASIYVFTDALPSRRAETFGREADSPLPDGPWSPRARAWIAPQAGDNAAIVALAAERRGKDVLARFTLANYGSTPRTLAGSVLVNTLPRVSNPREGTGFDAATLQPGETAERSVRFEETGAAAIEVKLDADRDALRADDAAYAIVPSLDELRVRVAWPNGTTRNAYVHAVLSALQDEGIIGSISETAGNAAATVFVDHAPAAWPEGGAIVLYPLGSGAIVGAALRGRPGQPHRAAPAAAIQANGLHKEPVTVTRQARHELLREVDLRGLVVKGAVEAVMPEWAEPLAWAGDLPVVWAGVTGQTKVLFVGIPLAPSGSRLPFVASFPVLMRNALLWMLPQAEMRRCGDRVAGWTSRRAGFIERPADGAVHAFSVLSAAESDLRRAEPIASEPIPHRRPLAAALVALAIVLLAVEWGLFHRRVTE